uniref:CSON013493 protein n=1 Tax=Culicoides sonorensis TaxID=179676 RepID=A0A336LMS1_CULSO
PFQTQKYNLCSETSVWALQTKEFTVYLASYMLFKICLLSSFLHIFGLLSFAVTVTGLPKYNTT